LEEVFIEIVRRNEQPDPARAFREFTAEPEQQNKIVSL